MNKNIKIPELELLLDYLDGILDKENSEKIRKEIEISEELKSIVDGIIHLRDVEGYDDEQIEAYVEKLQSDFESEKDIPKPTPSTKFNWLKIAASLLIFIGIWFITQKDFTPLSSDDFVKAQLSEAYPSPELFRNKNSNWTLVHKYYNEKTFDLAVNELLKIKESEPNNMIASFYLGLCYLYDNQATKAIEYLQSVSNSTSRLNSNSKWYISLAYLKNGNKHKAKSLLADIINTKSYNYEEAQELIQLLD